MSGLLKVGGNLAQWQQRSIPARYRSADFDGYWLEKDVFLHNQINKLVLAYPDAKFVWLMRSPEDCVSSLWLLHSEVRDTPHPIRYFANQWKAFDAERARIGGQVIHYEDLVAEPEAQIASLEDYLELEHGCSVNPADFDPRIALKAKIRHSEVLSEIALAQSKTGLLSEHTLSEMVEALYAANS